MSVDTTSYTKKIRDLTNRSREDLDKARESHRGELRELEVLADNKLENVKEAFTSERAEDAKDFSERVEFSNKDFKKRYDELKTSMLDRMREMATKNEKERTRVREEHQRQLASITKSYDEVVQMKEREIEELKEGHQNELRNLRNRNDRRVSTLVDDFTKRMEDSNERQREEIARFQKLT